MNPDKPEAEKRAVSRAISPLGQQRVGTLTDLSISTIC
jgi:hypothetical protein